MHKKFAEYKEMAEFLGSKRYSIDLLKEYYKEVFPHTMTKKGFENVGEIGKKREITNNAKKCLELVGEQPGAKYAEGYWWSPTTFKGECRESLAQSVLRKEPAAQDQGFR